MCGVLRFVGEVLENFRREGFSAGLLERPVNFRGLEFGGVRLGDFVFSEDVGNKVFHLNR